MKTLAETIKQTLTEGIEKNKAMKAMVEDVIKLGMTQTEAEFWVPREVTRLRIEMRRHQFIFTFGVEIECAHLNHRAFSQAMAAKGLMAEQQIYNHRDQAIFKMVTDGSLRGCQSGDTPLECVSPVLSGERGFGDLKACCDAFAETGAKVNRSCGLHVHIGAADINNQEYCNVFCNYMWLEPAIESFMAPSRRGRNAQWCASLLNHKDAVLTATTKYEMRRALGHDRYHRVNAEAYAAHKTIEFRQHQGSLDFEKISNWVKFLGRLVEWSKTNRLAHEVTRVEDIPFIDGDLKDFFIQRAAFFAGRTAQSA